MKVSDKLQFVAAAQEADRAGHDRHAVPPRVSAPIEIESAGVFERLASRDESAQVPHFRMAGYTADRFIGKRFDQSSERIALAMRVRVQENSNASAHHGQSALQRAGLAAIGLAQ